MILLLAALFRCKAQQFIFLSEWTVQFETSKLDVWQEEGDK